MVTTLPILQRCVRQHVTIGALHHLLTLVYYLDNIAYDFDLENIVKHGKLINKGFELYETINIHSVYIQNNAVHYDWVGANVAPLSTPFLGEDIDFKGNGSTLLYSLMELVGTYMYMCS